MACGYFFIFAVEAVEEAKREQKLKVDLWNITFGLVKNK